MMAAAKRSTDDSFPIRKSAEADRWRPKPVFTEAVNRKIEAKRMKDAGLRLHKVRADDGTVRDAWCLPMSWQAMGFQDHQKHAAERFGRDWEAAYRGLRGQSFEPGVDGRGNAHRFHEVQIMAQTRIRECEAYLGKRTWEIVVAVVAHGATVREMAELSGVDNRNIRTELETALNDLDGFYSKNRIKDRTWEAFERFNVLRSEMIEQAEREVG